MVVGQLPADFGETLASLRQGRMTQGELASAQGVDGSTISRYERGELIPSLADAQKLLGAIGTPEALDYAEYLGRQWHFLPRPAYRHPDRLSLWSCESTLHALDQVRRSADSESVRARVDLLETALRREADYLQSVAHDIAFFGQIAVGKTTALCTAAALMLPDIPGERRIKRTILEVGSGNVTVCEVVVRHDPARYGLAITPHSEDEITLCINDLCAGVIAAKAGDAGLDGERRGLPKEVERALRNMCELPKKPERGPDGKRVTVDPILALADGRSLSTLASEVFNRLRLSQRTQTELWYEQNSGMEPRAWLRKTFADVNNGHNTLVGLPRRMTVIAPLHTLATKPYDLRMIDTRGIDEPLADRPDLRTYLEDSRTIPVLCSAFAGPLDRAVEQLLQGSDDTGVGTGVAMRSMVLLLAKNDEALQVEHAETVEDGYETRNERARGDLRRIGRNSRDQRPEVISFNSDSDDPADLVEAVIGRVEAARSARRTRIEEIGAAANALAREALEVGVAKVYARVHDRLRVVNVAKLGPSGGRPFERLISAIRTLHPRTVWASVVRQGSWIYLDVFHYLGVGLAAEAEKRTRPQVNELELALHRMLASDDFGPVHGFLREAIKSVSDWHNEFIQGAALLGKDAFRPALKEATQLWSTCAAQYGTGRGFREPVAGYLLDWFNDAGQAEVFEMVEAGLADQWSTTFVAKVQKLIISVKPLAEPTMK